MAEQWHPINLWYRLGRNYTSHYCENLTKVRNLAKMFFKQRPNRTIVVARSYATRRQDPNDGERPPHGSGLCHEQLAATEMVIGQARDDVVRALSKGAG